MVVLDMGLLGSAMSVSNTLGLSMELEAPVGRPQGIYETDYGNACYVSGPKARRAWDLDAACWVPLEDGY